MKYSWLIFLLAVSCLLSGFGMGVVATDGSFSKRDYYLSWGYEYFPSVQAEKDCLFYWYRTSNSSHSGKKLFCQSKEYPI